MIRSLLDKIKAIPAFLGRLRTEPVMIVTVAMIVLTAFQSAQTGGLGTEDTLILIAEGVLGWLGRELVYPAVKVDAATAALKDPEPVLERPLGGE